MNINISIDDVDPADLPVTVVVDSGAYEDEPESSDGAPYDKGGILPASRPSAAAGGFLPPLDPKAV